MDSKIIEQNGIEIYIKNNGEIISPNKPLKHNKGFTKISSKEQGCSQRTVQLYLQMMGKIILDVLDFTKKYAQTPRKYNSGFTFTDCIKISRLSPTKQLIFMESMKEIINKPNWYKGYAWKSLIRGEE